MINAQTYYTDIFKITEAEMRRLVGTALEGGGDYADLFFENTTYHDLLLRDGQVASGGFHVDFGVGVRVLCGEKTGYAYSESTAYEDILAAAKAASAIASGKGNGTCNATPEQLIRQSRSVGAIYARQEANGGRIVRKTFSGKPNPSADRYPILKDWRTSSADSFIPILTDLQDKIFAREPRTVKVTAMLSDMTSDILMYNSFGEMKYETRPMGSLSATAVMNNGKANINKTASRSYRAGEEMLTDGLIEELVAEMTTGTDDRFAAGRPKGGQMDVVMAAGASGILLHEAMGHAFEADFNRKGQSIFSEKMGRQICPKGITIVDDATVRGSRGALNFDDEGIPGQRTAMVEDGVLTSYLHDRISARYYGVTPTGNGRRESFRFNPIPRMRTTYMESGDAEPEAIVASVKKGLFVNEFSNGQVKIGEGDFTFYVKSGYLIENGHLTMPVKDINVIGNGPQALADIAAVGNDLKMDDRSWTCGKEQSVPVSLGIPTVLVKNLTVGGE